MEPLPEDALQGYRLKMSYDDLVFVKEQLRQLNDDGTINNLEYTINCLKASYATTRNRYQIIRT